MTEDVHVLDLSAMTVAQLKGELKERSLKVSGTKAELIDRLEDYMQKHEGAEFREEDEDELLNEPEVSISEGVEEKTEEKEAEQEKTKSEDDKVDGGSSESKENNTVVDKKASRAERFGLVAANTGDEKKQSRAERFGLTTAANGDVEMDEK